MEASEQQRRPTIGQSAQKLRQLGLEFDAVDLADMLWLADQFIRLGVLVRPETPDSRPARSAQPSVKTIDDGESPASEPATNLYINDPSDGQSTSTLTLEDEEAEAEETPGTPFPVPAAPALRTPLDLARSLRPLMRKVPSRLRQELDEDATVTQIAETGLWVPVVRAQPERWLDLDLVVEDAKTTFIWERVITELQHLVEYQGAFRTIRTWRLAVPDMRTATAADVKLFPRWHETPENRAYQRPRSPRELIDPRSRRLVWVVTDCTSLLWRRGLIHDTLWAWAETQPVSIVQMFPERLWTRTALSDGHIVRLGAPAPGLPSARLEVEGLPALEAWDDDDDLEDAPPDADQSSNVNRAAVAVEQRQLVLPVVTLDPQAMHRWARVMAGSGDGLTPGRVFELKAIRQMAQEYQTWSAQTRAKPRTARQRLALFRSGASETAQQLVEYLAATPVSLPVIDLLRDEFVPQARQEHVAEVLLSGLLQRQDEPDDDSLCRYEFYVDQPIEPTAEDQPTKPRERVRNLLLDSVPVSRSREVLDHLSKLIGVRAGRSLDTFDAFLADFAESGEALGEGALPLAKVGLDVLNRLGGPHAALARQYARVIVDPHPPLGRETFPLQAVEYEVAEYLNIPPLQTETIRTPTIVAVLNQTFEFETAILERDSPPVGLRQGESTDWVIRRRRTEAWGYVESLRENAEVEDDLSLEMVALPGDTFTMGAPTEEPGSRDEERPQHEVTLQPFYMSRYPITQAQWRAVADAPLSLNLEAACRAADWAIRTVRATGLQPVERLILESIWQQRTYREIAAAAGYSEIYLRRKVGTALWRGLSEALGEPVDKSSFRMAIERWHTQRELNSAPSGFTGDNLPVETVSWEDAQEFCRRLSVLTGKDYRLPTEAEWEYACRAGTTTPFHFGETITADLANYDASHAFGDGPTGEYRERTTAVGQFPANGFGLHDMHGNVWEWCQDHWHENYEGAPTDGSAWLSSDESENLRVLRGGSWFSNPGYCRSADRDYISPDDTYGGVGFRVVCGLARD